MRGDAMLVVVLPFLAAWSCAGAAPLLAGALFPGLFGVAGGEEEEEEEEEEK
jgi:hypothetical protein